jgi:hypothetical protein
VIWVFGKAEYFFTGGWTGFFRRSPSGKSLRGELAASMNAEWSTARFDRVIASEAKQSMERQRKSGLLRRLSSSQWRASMSKARYLIPHGEEARLRRLEP